MASSLPERLQSPANCVSSCPSLLASVVVEELDIPTSTFSHEVLTLTLPSVEHVERAQEVETVNQLMSTAPGRSYCAVLGLESTLASLNEERVAKLVYSDGLRSAGMECPQCGALFSAGVDSCNACRAMVIAAPNVVECAVASALRQNVAIEVVKERAADLLNGAGGIGAFLKTAAIRSRTADGARSLRRRLRQ